MLYLKIMNAARGNDDHPRQGYRLLSGVKEVIFREPYDPITSDQSGKPSAFIWLHDCPEPVILDLEGSAYVMNEKGVTISRFEVSASRGHPETLSESRAYREQARDTAERQSARFTLKE